MEHAVLCFAALCYRQTSAVTEKSRPWLLIKSTTVSSADYIAMGKLHKEDTLATSTAERCNVIWLELSNKAYSWWSLKTSVQKKNDKTFLMEMIDRLFTKKCEFSWCLEMSRFCMRAAYFSLVVVVLYNWSRPLNKSCCLKGQKSVVCSSCYTCSELASQDCVITKNEKKKGKHELNEFNFPTVCGKFLSPHL